jgi:DNA-binding beta-propeller fold protein YncE
MKSTNNIARTIARTIASTLLLVATFATASFAATKPLSTPKGLAVDAKGNLYVANSSGNDILVYSPSYVQETSKTISQNVINPTGVAFDPWGHLWVANYGTSNGGANGSVAEYVNGVQNTNANITNGILGPNAIAVDPLGDVWVENDFVNVTIYTSTYPDTPPTTLARTFAPVFPMYGIAFGYGEFLYGSNKAVSVVTAAPTLATGATDGFGWSNDTGLAMGADAKGNVYMGNLDGSVNINGLGFESSFVKLSFAPTGIAVDSTRGRVYISNANGNSISVYSTAGALLHTIQ